MNRHVYFDNNATTALDARVLEAMLPFMSSQNNASSRHAFGRVARNAIDTARAQVADAVGAHPSQVTFTASGTEANNFAVQGIAQNSADKQIIISAIEHPCVSRPALALTKQGFKVHELPPNVQGVIEISGLDTMLNIPTALISVMLVNNETGAIQPVAALAQLAKEHGAMLHTDAVQALGKISVDFASLGVNAMTISSHKIGGPQGAGALILDKRVDIAPLLLGGGQEKGLRSGTENVAAIVGFGLACEIAIKEMKANSAHTAALRTQLEAGLASMGAVVFSTGAARIPNTSFFAFTDIEGETLVMALDRKGYAVASGSACSSDSTLPSHVLLSMGVAPDLARGAIRVSLSAHNTSVEISGFLSALQQELARLKQLTAMCA